MSLATDFPIIIGPQKSERLGLVLGVDLGLQDSALAVSRDNRMPRASVVVTTAARNLIRLSKAGEKFETLVVFGSERDATLHPDFREITVNLRDLRNKWFSKAKLCLMSEDPHFENPDVRLSLGIYDRVLARFEWGTAKTFATATKRKSTDLADIQTALTNLEHLVVYARFQRGDADNSSDPEIKSWIKRLTELRPREVHILTAELKAAAAAAETKAGAKPAKAKGKPLPKSRISEIAAEVTKKTGLATHLFGTETLLG